MKTPKKYEWVQPGAVGLCPLTGDEMIFSSYPFYNEKSDTWWAAYNNNSRRYNLHGVKPKAPAPLTLIEYQERTSETAIYPDKFALFYLTLGLVGEAGEVAEHIKKAIRDNDGVIGERKRSKIKKELGDVMWYVAQLAAQLNLSLDDVAAKNLDKLRDRKARSVLMGSGDDR